MSNFLVTGGAGFIGSYIAKRLINENNSVWIIDNLSTGFKENVPAEATFVYGNCQDPTILASLAKIKFDAIIHMAAQSSGEISFENPIYDLQANVESTLGLCDFALKNGCQRFIYASSMSIYGIVTELPVKEDHRCEPLSFYGVGKLASEKYLKIYEKKGLKPTILRFFNVYGPGQNMGNLKQGMVSIYLAQLLNDDKMTVKGSLDRFRDLIYIEDVVDAVMLSLKSAKAVDKIFNVGTGRRTTVKELLKKLMDLSEIHKPIIEVGPTPGDQFGIYADVSKIKNELSFSPKYTLEEGLRPMIDWAKTSESRDTK